jgi:type I restriction enzyme S subunit
MYSVTQQEFLLRIRRLSLEQNDIVYGREGERWGFAAQIPASDTFCLGQRMMQFRAAAGINPRFLMWQLNAQSTYRQGQVDTAGATSPHVNVSTIRNYVLTHPPIEEQDEIGEFLDAETSRLDKLDAESARTISLLKERRSALITATVTGQIDLRSAISQMAAESPEAIAA